MMRTGASVLDGRLRRGSSKTTEPRRGLANEDSVNVSLSKFQTTFNNLPSLFIILGFVLMQWDELEVGLAEVGLSHHTKFWTF
jgi:hypothetical protein